MPSPGTRSRSTDQSILDDALTAFADTPAQDDAGLSNHGPMVVETLFTLGRVDVIPSFTEHLLQSLPHVPIVPIMGGGDPTAMVGHPERFHELRAAIARDLAMGIEREDSFVPPIRAWVAHLAGAPLSAAGHGLIRTFHAWRSTQREPSAAAIDELATALAYWASTWSPIPLDLGGTVSPTAPPLQVLTGLPRLDESERGGPIMGLIAPALALDDVADAVCATHLPESSDALFDAITQAGARAFLADGGRHPHSMAHAVTLPAAARQLATLLDESDRILLGRRCWEAVAVLAVALGSGALTDAPPPSPPLDVSIGAAVETGDAHAVKVAEACLREAHLQPGAADLFAATCAAGADRLHP